MTPSVSSVSSRVNGFGPRAFQYRAGACRCQLRPENRTGFISGEPAPHSSAARPGRDDAKVQPRISATNNRPLPRRTAVVTATAVTVVIGVLVAGLVGSGPPSVPAQHRNAYVPAPKQLLVDAEIRFSQLPNSRLRHVRVMPTAAKRIAVTSVRGEGHPRVTFESLGGYIDANEIIPDWVGTKSWIPKATPAYLVRMTGLRVPTLGPTDGFVHKETVIIDAVTGVIEGTTAYD